MPYSAHSYRKQQSIIFILLKIMVEEITYSEGNWQKYADSVGIPKEPIMSCQKYHRLF